MELRQTKGLGPLDHHNRRIGHVHAHFDHRGCHQHAGFARLKSRHRRVFLRWRHLPMDQSNDTFTQRRAEPFEPLFSRGQIHRFAFFNQRTDPIALSPFRHHRAQPVHHLVHAAGADQSRLDRFATGRFFIQHRHVHVAILRQGEGPRNRCGRHHKHIRIRALFAQFKPLAHTEPVLFINNRKAQIRKMHVSLKHRMGANQHLNIARSKCRKLGAPFRPFVASRQDLKHDTRSLRQRLQSLQVLSGQDFSRCHHDTLPARLDRNQQCHESDQGFARPDIPLQKPVHPNVLRHVIGDFGDRPFLRRRRRIGKRPAHFGLQPLIATAGTSAHAPFGRTRKRKRQLMRHQLIISEPRARRMGVSQIADGLRRMCLRHRSRKVWPSFAGKLRGINPFVQHGHQRQGRPAGLEHRLLRHPRRKRIDRFEERNFTDIGLRHDVFRVYHLDDAVEHLDLTRHDACASLGQNTLQIIAPSVEKNDLKAGLRILDLNAIGAPPIARRVMRAHLHLYG
mmetsp:Transcript_27885/g.52103  ORF Transcript_27885/g.52103 Transcript_27885/m.52103 type:complete len:508 (+) Transcript_27885:1055-2578(+)